MTDGNRIETVNGALGALGIACLVVAMFLPYVSPPPEYLNVVNNDLIHHDGWVFGLIAAFAGLRLLFAYQGNRDVNWRRALCIGGIAACGLAAVGLANKDSRLVSSVLSHDSARVLLGRDVLPDVVAPPGAGLYVALGGGGLLLLAGLTRRANPLTEELSTPPAPQAPSEGWYVDPTITNQLRWWDGSKWTGATKDATPPT